MNKLVQEGLVFRVDKHCPMTRNNMAKLTNLRTRHAMYSFRQLFSHNPIEGNMCAGQNCISEEKVMRCITV